MVSKEHQFGILLSLNFSVWFEKDARRRASAISIPRCWNGKICKWVSSSICGWASSKSEHPKPRFLINIPNMGIIGLVRLWLSIIYAKLLIWGLADKKLHSLHLPPSPSTSSPPFSLLTSPIFLSFLSLAGPDPSNWRELLALLQTVRQLQRRVYGGKSVFLFSYAKLLFLLVNSAIWSVPLDF